MLGPASFFAGCCRVSLFLLQELFNRAALFVIQQ